MIGPLEDNFITCDARCITNRRHHSRMCLKPYNRICIEVKRWVFGKNNRGARQEARFVTKKKKHAE